MAVIIAINDGTFKPNNGYKLYSPFGKQDYVGQGSGCFRARL